MRFGTGSLLFVVLVLSACTATSPPRERPAAAVDSVKQAVPLTQVERRASMVGKWYGSAPTRDGGRNEWIVERHPDGTYTASFRLTETSGEVREWQEVGIWGVAGDIYFSVFKGWLEGGQLEPSDPADPYNYDAYRILSLNGSRMEYESVESENRFVVQKVDERFLFPGGSQ